MIRLVLALFFYRYPAYVRSAVLQATAVMWKRGWINDDNTNRDELFQQLQQLCTARSLTHKHVGGEVCWDIIVDLILSGAE